MTEPRRDDMDWVLALSVKFVEVARKWAIQLLQPPLPSTSEFISAQSSRARYSTKDQKF